MRLYYMTSERWGSSNLAHKHLKFSRFDDLNDPFELVSAHLGERSARRFYNALRSAVAERFGVICFSDNWRSPVMWAHYGDKHKGLCLGFDVREAAEVKYEPQRLKHRLDDAQGGVHVTAGLVELAMTTKFDEWEYEREWRVFKELANRHSDGNYYEEFGDFIQLREVIIGSRCNLTANDISKLVGDVEQSVTVIKARPAFQRFEVVRQTRVKPVVMKKRGR
ncbi:DUF2971 domain-containing protein [Paraburkholderia kirstenboschensis]|uniref:DUF2971 domain-containing protein n=1 Tax=Paraburkholderia kirstenboschensis TaxID=1245436 RepID=A0ABZ0EP47_9BURK|nr:DUF2971 domain-containing protein [Paraburkholderia kirstenboschensis]WOD18973.1 DUF2971 domain-containing protein [Paraburkholderia kirstenboschensis]